MSTVTEQYTGTSTIGTTEWSLTNNSSTVAAKTDQGGLQVWLDLSAMAAGDQFELIVYEKIVTGGTQRRAWRQTFTGPQTDPHTPLPTVLVKWGWDVTLKKLAGTDRSITWSLRMV